jgi:hypothetical protein
MMCCQCSGHLWRLVTYRLRKWWTPLLERAYRRGLYPKLVLPTSTIVNVLISEVMVTAFLGAAAVSSTIDSWVPVAITLGTGFLASLAAYLVGQMKQLKEVGSFEVSWDPAADVKPLERIVEETEKAVGVPRDESSDWAS